MNRSSQLALLALPFCLALLASAPPAFAGHADDGSWRRHAEPVSVEIVGGGRVFRQYRLHGESTPQKVRAYLAAEPGREYAIRVRNNTGERMGLVIAVDGRNIISGARSELLPRERMYVLGPWQSATYKGWRRDERRVNQFFFTAEERSYAGAFGDYSAMGVIAVAAFAEKERQYQYHDQDDGYRGRPESGSSNRKGGDASSADESRQEKSARAAPGTGYGDSRRSRAVRVDFEPQKRPLVRQFLKYEWRETLCEMGIGECRRSNRFWRDSVSRSQSRGFAPPPPRYAWRR